MSLVFTHIFTNSVVYSSFPMFQDFFHCHFLSCSRTSFSPSFRVDRSLLCRVFKIPLPSNICDLTPISLHLWSQDSFQLSLKSVLDSTPKSCWLKVFSRLWCPGDAKVLLVGNSLQTVKKLSTQKQANFHGLMSDTPCIKDNTITKHPMGSNSLFQAKSSILNHIPFVALSPERINPEQQTNSELQRQLAA